MSDILHKLTTQSGKDGGWLFWCPGCKCGHCIPNDGRWVFNGNPEKPTFTPSLLLNATVAPERRCHLYVTEGHLQFLPDCAHEFKGRTVPMEPL